MTIARRLNLVILEDDPALLRLTQRVVEKNFPDLAVAAFGEEEAFREYLHEHTIDILITDFNLRWAHLNGFTCAQLVKQLNPESYVIMITGSREESQLVEEAAAFGLDEYLLKTEGYLKRLVIPLRHAVQHLQVRRMIHDLELHYTNLIESLPINLYRFTPNGYLLDGTPALLKLLEMPSKELLVGGSIYGILVAPKDRASFEEQLRERGFVHNFPTVLTTMSGRTLWVQHNVRSVHDRRGNLLYYHGMVEDVTRERESAQALSQSLAQIEHAKQEWERTVDALPQLIAVLTSDWRIQRINHTVSRWDLGDIRHVLGKPLHQVLHRRQCEVPDECYLQQWLSNASPKLEQGESVDLEILDPVLYRYLHFRLIPTEPINTAEESRRRAICIVQDISETKRTHEALHQYVERLNILHQIDRAILEVRSPVIIARNALLWMQHILPYQYAAVLTWDTLQPSQITELVFLNEEQTTLERLTTLSAQAAPVLNTLRRQQTFLHEGQSDQDAHLTDAFGELHPHSYLYQPLIVGDQLAGCVFIGFKVEHHFSADEREFIEQIANQVAVALHNTALLQESQATSRRLRRLSHRLTHAQEEERRRLARELHDDIGQELTALKMRLHLMAEEAPGDDQAVAFRQLTEEVDRVLQKVRTLSHTLRPAILDDLGLIAALRWLVGRFAEQYSQITFSFSSEVEDLPLPEATRLTAYRIVQEALTNAVKHAQPQHIWVNLHVQNQKLRLEISDDGVGMDVQRTLSQAGSQGLGLLSLIERAESVGGETHLLSRPGEGAHITVTLPLEEENAA